jgi:two-component system chemotaxis response regulator CheB
MVGSFFSAALLKSQSERIEETLWIALRMFEERKNLLNNIAQKETRPEWRKHSSQKANESEVHIERIRAMLLSPESSSK